MGFQDNPLSSAFGAYSASNTPPAAGQIAQGISNLGTVFTGGNPEDIAKAHLYRAQTAEATATAQQQQMKNTAMSSLAGVFANATIHNPDGTFTLDPNKLGPAATAILTLEPKGDITPLFKAVNSSSEAAREQQFALQKQNNEVKTMAPGESMVRANMVGNPAQAAMTPAQGAATFQQPDMPSGGMGLPASPSAPASLAQVLQPAPTQGQGDDPSAFQSAVANGIPIYDRLADAQKAAPYANGFSHAEDTGFTPRPQVVSLSQALSGGGQQQQAQGDGIAPAAFTRDANGALTSTSQIKPAHLPEAGVRDLGDDLEMIRQIDLASGALKHNPGAIGPVKGHVPNWMLQVADPSGIPARATLAGVMNSGFHDLYQSRLTEREIQQGGLQLPTMNDTPEAAQAKLAFMRNRVTQDLNDKAQMYSPKSGYVMDPVMADRIKQFSQGAPGMSAPAQPGAQAQPKPLDANTAQQFLSQAGGDKNKARQLAAQAGYTF